MTALHKKGYHITIEHWIGKLGNHLIQLSGALNVARKTQSKLTIPVHPLLRRNTFDFTDKANDNCLEPVSGRFFFKADCFQHPFEYDRDRRAIFQAYVHDLLVERSFRERLDDMMGQKPVEPVTSETLVINMRSGRDIFRKEPPPLNDYMQPPLSYYKHILESNNYENCLIVTEADRKNPCIDALMAWSPKVRIKTHTSVKDDLQVILGASHLVMCHSTFSWCLALMSRHLRRLYQPHSFQIRGVGEFSTDTYLFDNYIMPGEWKCSPEQLEMMVNHSIDDLKVFHKPIRPAESVEPEPSNFW